MPSKDKKRKPVIDVIFAETGIQAIFVASLAATVIYSHDFLSEEPVITWIILSVVAIPLAVLPFLEKNKDLRRKYLTIAGTLAWLLAIAILFPINSPLLLFNLVVGYFALSAIGEDSVGLVVVSTLIAMLISVLRQQYDTVPADLWYPAMHIASMGLFMNYAAKILERERHDKELLQSEATSANLERQRLLALINGMADGVIATDEDKKVIFYNGAALEILNINTSLEGQAINKYLKLVGKSGRKIDIFSKAKKSQGRYISTDLRFKQTKDELINIYLSLASVRLSYSKTKVLGYIIILRDITKEKSLEEERDEFVSVVSHELRTPITIAEGAISNTELVLKKGGTKTAAQESVEQAHQTVVYLAEMINDLSMLSRAERGKLMLEPNTIDIHAMFERLKEDYKVQFDQKGIKLVTKAAKNIKNVNSSQLYIREILQNFITNALKYTEKGSVTISAINQGSGVLFSVRDTGIGISKSDQKHLYEKFFRSEDFRMHHISGTGIGLYVTLKLAQLIKGELNVSSTLNKGSEFTLYVPNLDKKGNLS